MTSPSLVLQVRHEQEELREELRLSLEGSQSVSLSCQKKREMQSRKGVVIFFKVCVYEWRAAEMKWAAPGTASRILDAERKPGEHTTERFRIKWLDSIRFRVMRCSSFETSPVRVTAQCNPEPPTSTSSHSWSGPWARHRGLCF